MPHFTEPDFSLDEYRKYLGFCIRSLRRMKGLTAKQLADKAQINLRHLRITENGQSNLTLKFIFKISQALEVPIQELLSYSFAEVAQIESLRSNEVKYIQTLHGSTQNLISTIKRVDNEIRLHELCRIVENRKKIDRFDFCGVFIQSETTWTTQKFRDHFKAKEERLPVGSEIRSNSKAPSIIHHFYETLEKSQVAYGTVEMIGGKRIWAATKIGNSKSPIYVMAMDYHF